MSDSRITEYDCGCSDWTYRESCKIPAHAESAEKSLAHSRAYTNVSTKELSLLRELEKLVRGKRKNEKGDTQKQIGTVLKELNDYRTFRESSSTTL